MPPTNAQWSVRPQLPPEVSQALNSFPPVVRQILFNRGRTSTTDAQAYLSAAAPQGTGDRQLGGVAAATDRLLAAIRAREEIAVYGDYDVDGVTATALLVQTLSSLGARIRPYIPNRFSEGYGLNTDALQDLSDLGVGLVVTVDCGIRALEEASFAAALGLELIISDHHHPGAELPTATAIINPKQQGDDYPEKDLSGVGLAYKLAVALLEQASPAPVLSPDDLLDLVALGTVADLAPLVGENRALVRGGLRRLERPRRQGLMALMGVAGLVPARIRSSDIGFVLGPRLNAAGRLNSAKAAYRLLVSEDLHECGQLAQKLDNQNRERQKLTREIEAHAEAQVLASGDIPLLLFAAHPDYNPGVVGLAAARLAQRYYRPSIVAHQETDFTRASCRSIPEFHITAALDECAPLLERYGGHAAAAGFTVRNDRLSELVARLQDLAEEALGTEDLRPEVSIDAEIPLAELNPDLIHYLDLLEPTGVGNREAVFLSRGLLVKRKRTVGREGAHLKLTLSDGRIVYDAIAFRQGEMAERISRHVDAVYTFETNHFQGRTSLQLNVKDLRPSE